MKNTEIITTEITLTQVSKSTDPLLRQITYIAMLPGIDLHGDETTVDEVRKAHASFARSEQRVNLFHMKMTDSAWVLESYLAPIDMTLNGNFVCKGSWLMTLQIVTDGLWEMIEKSEITGISIGAVANVEEVG